MFFFLTFCHFRTLFSLTTAALDILRCRLFHCHCLTVHVTKGEVLRACSFLGAKTCVELRGVFIHSHSRETVSGSQPEETYRGCTCEIRRHEGHELLPTIPSRSLCMRLLTASPSLHVCLPKTYVLVSFSIRSGCPYATTASRVLKTAWAQVITCKSAGLVGYV